MKKIEIDLSNTPNEPNSDFFSHTLLGFIFPIISILLLSEMIYFAYFTPEINKKTATVAVSIEKTQILPMHRCYFTNRHQNDGTFCLEIDYSYSYNGISYEKNNIHNGKLFFTKEEAEKIKNKIIHNPIAYIDIDKPSKSQLLTKKEYVDALSGNYRSKFILLLAPIALLFGIFNFYDHCKQGKIAPPNNIRIKTAALSRRFSAFLADCFVYITSLVVLIFLNGNLYLSDYVEKPILMTIYIKLGWLLLIFLGWFICRKSFGMFALNLYIVDYPSMRRPSKKQIMIRCLVTVFIVLLGGLPLLLALFDKKFLTIADKISKTVLVHRIYQLKKEPGRYDLYKDYRMPPSENDI